MRGDTFRKRPFLNDTADDSSTTLPIVSRSLLGTAGPLTPALRAVALPYGVSIVATVVLAEKLRLADVNPSLLYCLHTLTWEERYRTAQNFTPGQSKCLAMVHRANCIVWRGGQ